MMTTLDAAWSLTWPPPPPTPPRRLTGDPKTVFKADFGRSITTNNPLTLFTITGSSRVDVVRCVPRPAACFFLFLTRTRSFNLQVYSKELGELYVLATVADITEPTVRVNVELGRCARTSPSSPSSSPSSSLSLALLSLAHSLAR